MKTNGFTEFTYTNGKWEVMVHVDARERITRLYTYRRDAEEINSGGYDGQNGKPLHPFHWKDGLNPLFVDLNGHALKRFVSEFIESGELVCTEREEAA